MGRVMARCGLPEIFKQMRTLGLALSFALPLVAAAAAPAFAQSGPPGACECAAPAYPAYPIVAPAAASWDDAHRFGVGLRLSSLGLRPDANPDDETQFAGGGLTFRYRASARWELEFTAEHFREQLDNGEQGEAELDSGTFSLLFHMAPSRRWDWYLLAGIGGTEDGREDISDAQREATSQAHVHLGVGIERRFGQLGIAAEVRAVGMARSEKEDRAVSRPSLAPTSPSSDDPETTSGGQLTLLATYYL
jgi:hypothetical protein